MRLLRTSKRLAPKALRGEAARPCPMRRPPQKREFQRRLRRSSHRLLDSVRLNGASQEKLRPPPFPSPFAPRRPPRRRSRRRVLRLRRELAPAREIRAANIPPSTWSRWHTTSLKRSCRAARY